ncbi:MAG TPA: hypothetical protein VG711_06040, partial [Phycisphaerales bacterium]|nr:hypothetical protein [Phycisphaerales bacterium]
MHSRVVQNLMVFGIAAWMLLGVYSGALNGGMLLDDDNLIYESAVVRDPHALPRIWMDVNATTDYYPLTYTSWWLDLRLAELFNISDHFNVSIHLENIVLQAISCMLVWMIARRLGINAWGAALAAGMFALHPLQVESVAWMSQRKNVLSGLFYLLSAYGFVRGVMETDRFKPTLYSFALGMFLCALFAKPRVMTLAASLIVLAWWKGGVLWKRRAALALPFLALAAPMAWWTMHIQKTHVGTSLSIFNHTLPERCVIAGKVLLFSLGKLVWPADLSFAYHRWNIDTHVFVNWLPAITCIAILASAWMAIRWIGRSVFATLAHIVISLSPSLGFISIFWHRYYWTADHEQYLNVIGFGLFIGGTIGAWMEGRQLFGVRNANQIPPTIASSAGSPRDRVSTSSTSRARGKSKQTST